MKKPERFTIRRNDEYYDDGMNVFTADVTRATLFRKGRALNVVLRLQDGGPVKLGLERV